MRVAILLVMSFLCLAVQAQVYRWVDAEGKVHYTDRPHEGAEQVAVPTSRAADPAEDEGEGEGESGAPRSASADGGEDYESFSILAPTENQTVSNPAREVSISLMLAPGLQSGHSLRMTVNGEVQGQPLKATQFRLTQLTPGTHSLQVAVHDADGNTVATTQTVNFHFKPPPPPAQEQ